MNRLNSQLPYPTDQTSPVFRGCPHTGEKPIKRQSRLAAPWGFRRGRDRSESPILLPLKAQTNPLCRKPWIRISLLAPVEPLFAKWKTYDNTKKSTIHLQHNRQFASCRRGTCPDANSHLPSTSLSINIALPGRPAASGSQGSTTAALWRCTVCDAI